MDLLNLLKIITAIITVVIAFIGGFLELRLNPKNWLNRWFVLFFMSASLAFLTYSLYHLITDVPDPVPVIIPIMLTTQVLYNFAPVTLVMTVFVLEKYEKIAMSLKYLGTMMVLFIIMSVGYFILIPELNMVDYTAGIVNTETNRGLFIFVNLIRIALFLYVVYRYAMINKKVEQETKKRVQWFFIGVLLITGGVFINLIGGLIDSIELEILALIFIDIGIGVIVRGFFV